MADLPDARNDLAGGDAPPSRSASNRGKHDDASHRGDRHQGADPSGGEGDEGERKENEGERKEKKPFNPVLRIFLIIAALVVILAVLAYGFYWWTRGSYYQSTNDAYMQADQVSISPRISGFVDAVLVGDNQHVVAGQVLVRLSARDYAAKAERDRAQIAEAQAGIVQADAEIRQQEAMVSQSLAQLAQSQAQERQYAASAQFNVVESARYKPLARSGAETGEKASQYDSQARQATAQLDAARAQSTADAAKVEYARRQIDVYKAERLSSEAKVREGQAQLASDEVDVGGADLVSPIDGRVGDRTVRVGQYLQTGTRVMTIVPVQAIYLKANFKETQIGLMRVGQPASIKVDALDGIEIHGEVESFSPGTGAQFSLAPTDNATGNFTKITQRVPVRIRVDSGPEARRVLVPGLSVVVSVDTIGAKSELSAYKEETKGGSKEREREDKQENEQDREHHAAGAGT